MPRPFRFSLQQVLAYRKQLEEQAKLAFSVALRAHDAQKARLDDLRQRLCGHEARWFESPMSAADIWLWQRYRDRLTAEIKAARDRLAALRQTMDAKRQAMVERSKERKLLERLRSNQAMAHLRQENLREQREFDEMATLRYRHQNI